HVSLTIFPDGALTTKPNQAVFWSAIPGGDTQAAEWASQNGGVTMGMLMSKYGLSIPRRGTAGADTIAQSYSELFAGGASGNVRVLQGGVLRRDAFFGPEFWRMVPGSGVTSITAIDIDTRQETTLWSK